MLFFKGYVTSEVKGFGRISLEVSHMPTFWEACRDWIQAGQLCPIASLANSHVGLVQTLPLSRPTVDGDQSGE